METDLFVVLPSLGPLVAGHVMVVSKLHCNSLAAMGLDAVSEYERLAAALRSGPQFLHKDPLEAEHGSGEREKAGACVIHTHVHWLPGMGRFLEEFKGRLLRRPESDLLQLVESCEPYLFVRSSCAQAIFDGRGLRSQTVRRILCEVLDRDDVDWVRAPRLDWVEETVSAWQEEPEGLKKP